MPRCPGAAVADSSRMSDVVATPRRREESTGEGDERVEGDEGKGGGGANEGSGDCGGGLHGCNTDRLREEERGGRLDTRC